MFDEDLECVWRRRWLLMDSASITSNVIHFGFSRICINSDNEWMGHCNFILWLLLDRGDVFAFTVVVVVVVVRIRVGVLQSVSTGLILLPHGVGEEVTEYIHAWE